MQDNQNLTNDTYVSLFDFLGRPAGIELGTKVYKESCRRNEKTKIRNISNKKYTGKIMLYRQEFLEQYFTLPNNDILDDDKLPF